MPGPPPYSYFSCCLNSFCWPATITTNTTTSTTSTSIATRNTAPNIVRISLSYSYHNYSRQTTEASKLILVLLLLMSASHEKSPTELTLRQHPSSRSSSTFSFCVWVPVCATLACWQVSNETRSVLGQTKMVPVRWTKYPAVPTGLAVGTNPPGLPSGDHRWGVWEWVKSSVPRIRSVGYSSIQIRY